MTSKKKRIIHSPEFKAEALNLAIDSNLRAIDLLKLHVIDGSTQHI